LSASPANLAQVPSRSQMLIEVTPMTRWSIRTQRMLIESTPAPCTLKSRKPCRCSAPVTVAAVRRSSRSGFPLAAFTSEARARPRWPGLIRRPCLGDQAPLRGYWTWPAPPPSPTRPGLQLLARRGSGIVPRAWKSVCLSQAGSWHSPSPAGEAGCLPQGRVLTGTMIIVTLSALPTSTKIMPCIDSSI
jgi:hypothetical protein